MIGRNEPRPFDSRQENREEVSTAVADQLGSLVAHQVDIGLKNDQIMQRYLVRRIYREVEFRVREFDGQDTVGYITGFDDKCLQLSTTPANAADEPHSVLIFWPIRRIEETGGKIDDLEPDHRSKIRSYSHALRAQCEVTLNGSKVQGQQRNSRPPRANGASPSFSDAL